MTPHNLLNIKQEYNLFTIRESQKIIHDHDIKITDGKSYINNQNLPSELPKEKKEKLCCIFSPNRLYGENDQLFLINTLSKTSIEALKRTFNERKDSSREWKILELRQNVTTVDPIISSESQEHNKENLEAEFDLFEIYNNHTINSRDLSDASSDEEDFHKSPRKKHFFISSSSNSQMSSLEL